MTDIPGPAQVMNATGVATILMSGNDASITVGNVGHAGEVYMGDSKGSRRVALEGHAGRVTLWRSGAAADLEQRRAITLRGDTNSLEFRVNGKRSLVIDGNLANMTIGCPDVAGNIAVFGSDISDADSASFNKAKIHLDGGSGDIILSNADCAEDFEIAGAAELAPGTVVVMDEAGGGRLRESNAPYDRTVAGIISGAGGYRPGIVLDRQPESARRAPVAMVGKVFCKVDGTDGAIEIGDLLTTSARSGHAMKAHDSARAFGAVIGKALGAHRGGPGLIPVLVALQ